MNFIVKLVMQKSIFKSCQSSSQPVIKGAFEKINPQASFHLLTTEMRYRFH